jgi:mannose-1-phosphate guanylyltransferase
MEQNNIYCVIMAGGVGSRFWPLSRQDKPKQFLDILGTGTTLIRQTFLRVTKFCPQENVYVVTSTQYRNQVIELLPEVPVDQILLEPMRRNTAPCIAFANHKIAQKNPNALVVVAPSDHLILDENKFVETVQSALHFAEQNDALLTIGIKPSRPETGYGYIQISKPVDKKTSNLYKVKTFTEKPTLEMAKVLLETGEFFWNSGVFIWSLKSINKAFEKYLPEVNRLFYESSHHFSTPMEESVVTGLYSECKNISIDYGVMEKADNVYVICSEFGWSDLGTWGSLYQNGLKNSDGNVISGGKVFTYEVTDSIVKIPNEKLLVAQGLKDYIIVESDNILLICTKENEQEIKKYLNDVLSEMGEKYI